MKERERREKREERRREEEEAKAAAEQAECSCSVLKWIPFFAPLSSRSPSPHHRLPLLFAASATRDGKSIAVINTVLVHRFVFASATLFSSFPYPPSPCPRQLLLDSIHHLEPAPQPHTLTLCSRFTASLPMLPFTPLHTIPLCAPAAF